MPSFAHFILPTLLLAGEALAGGCTSKATAKAAYFITNGAKNEVVAVPISPDGKLSGGSKTFTQGYGAISIDGATKGLAATDGLVSQGSLSIVGDNLFVVNAGSNTVSMFSIDKKDPTKLTLVGQPAAVPGEFTSTVAASAKNNIVCAGTTGKKAGISCAPFDAQNGIGQMDDLREFDLKQTTPPVGPTNTLSQVFFADDENSLFATVKGDPTKNNTGFLAEFPVQEQQSEDDCDATVARDGTQKSPEGTAVLFGAQPIPRTSNIFSTDAAFGAAVLSVKDQGNPSVLGKQEIDGQKATCWVTISKLTKTAFVTDVATPRIIEMSLTDAKILGQIDLKDAGIKGMIDLKASGKFMYALAPDAKKSQVMVLDLQGGSQNAKKIQSFDVSKFTGASAQGMVILERRH